MVLTDKSNRSTVPTTSTSSRTVESEPVTVPGVMSEYHITFWPWKALRILSLQFISL